MLRLLLHVNLPTSTWCLLVFEICCNACVLSVQIQCSSGPTPEALALGLHGISIFSNIGVFFFKGICNNTFLVNTVIPYIAILSANLAFLGVKSLVNDNFTQ